MTRAFIRERRDTRWGAVPVECRNAVENELVSLNPSATAISVTERSPCSSIDLACSNTVPRRGAATNCSIRGSTEALSIYVEDAEIGPVPGGTAPDVAAICRLSACVDCYHDALAYFCGSGTACSRQHA